MVNVAEFLIKRTFVFFPLKIFFIIVNVTANGVKLSNFSSKLRRDSSDFLFFFFFCKLNEELKLNCFGF